MIPLPKLSLKTWLTIGGGIIAVLLVYFAYLKVHDHFQHIKDIEASNASLTKQNTDLNKKVNDLADQNESNKQAYETKLQQAENARRIAEDERQAAEKRATRYRSIRDAAKDTPAQDRRPVGPAVQSTVDRLWSQP